MRGRSYTPSPPPPRGYGRRDRSPPRGGRHGREDAPTSLLVRNLRHDCRPEDLRRPFGNFGIVKDIYLPRDYYTGNPRGFGFVQFMDSADAAEAKYQMDGQTFQGRELTVVFAEENRKKPTDMRARERGGSRGRVYDRRRSPPPRHSRSPRYSRSPPPRPSRSRDYYSPPKRRYSRSISPREKRYSREASYSRSPVREQSPPYDGPGKVVRSPERERSPYGPRKVAGSPARERSPYGSRSRSPSPGPVRSPVRARSVSRSRSRSPHQHPGYPREAARGRSPSQ